MTIDQVMALLRQVMPIVGTMLTVFGLSSATATQYLVYCRPHPPTPLRSADNRRSVIKYVRSGRAARNQLETYVAAGNAGPSWLYNTLIAFINQLNLSPAASGAPR